jgi:hypothetical protein
MSDGKTQPFENLLTNQTHDGTAFIEKLAVQYIIFVMTRDFVRT